MLGGRLGGVGSTRHGRLVAWNGSIRFIGLFTLRPWNKATNPNPVISRCLPLANESGFGVDKVVE